MNNDNNVNYVLLQMQEEVTSLALRNVYIFLNIDIELNTFSFFFHL